MRALDGLVAVLILIGLLALAHHLARAPTVLSGPVQVVDGDTLRLSGTTIRLAGMDAPELRQTCTRDGQSYACGEVARQELRRLTAGRSLDCEALGTDRYRRQLALCRLAGRDLGAEMVEQGLAVAYGRYEAQENAARRRRVGLWAGTFERPSDWRQAHAPHLSAPASN